MSIETDLAFHDSDIRQLRLDLDRAVSDLTLLREAINYFQPAEEHEDDIRALRAENAELKKLIQELESKLDRVMVPFVGFASLLIQWHAENMTGE
jgi:hypothetical protein